MVNIWIEYKHKYKATYCCANNDKKKKEKEKERFFLLWPASFDFKDIPGFYSEFFL